jgi:V-type H+-transporting ATPase subunit F
MEPEEPEIGQYRRMQRQHAAVEKASALKSGGIGARLADRHLIYVIGDEDTVTGFLLAGIGNKDSLQQKNYFIADSKTPQSQIEDTFKSFISRKDAAILLINQHVADQIRTLIEEHHDPFPALLEIPSKDHPYDPEKDTIMQRVERMYSNE